MIDDNLHQYLAGYTAPLLVAVSGGMDSIVLLHLLVNRRENHPFSLHVVTFDHAIRPDSGEDVEFVRQLCAEWDVPCTAGRVDYPLRDNIEASARQARYQFLVKVAHDVGAEWISTAHHADDQAETILLHLFRGSGLRGLGGMRVSAPLPYDEQLNVLRPMLHLSRAQIERYCHEHGLSYRHDMTNDDISYRRNYIRHVVFPMLATINSDVMGALNRLGKIATQDYQFLSDVTQIEFDRALIRQSDDFIALNRQYFYQLHASIQRHLLLKMGWELYQLAPTHERMIEAYELIHSARVGTFVEFIGAKRLYLDYEALIVGDYQSYFRQTLPYIRLNKGDVIEIDLGVSEQIYRVGEAQLLITQTQRPLAVRLTVREGQRMIIRTRQEGDYFAPLGMDGRGKKLKSWMIDRKIPQVIRDEIGLIELDRNVVAVLVGEHWAMGYQATDETDTYLYISDLH